MTKRVAVAVAIIVGLTALPAPGNAQESDKPDIPALANQICDSLRVYDAVGAGELHEAFELVLLDDLEIDKASTPSYRIKVRDFWNEHHEQMICTNVAQGHIAPQYLLKRIIEMQGVSSFFFEYFLADRKLEINAVELRAGRRETLVDYIDLILADPDADQLYDVNEVRRLRRFLTEFMSGKRAADIP